ncbi:cytochrome c oxidase subunit 5A, mitochondrial-like [Octopus vulgaris]|uniref:Cytochrome c oxidase subunit 5A, mitochondrial-like n=2 Tax=Octopus TaxID=6643 RepID=A0AA36FB31_OCTVU|nr:cytochrome c oxidase subunit 5A, mitochondrial [Octopus sinensis]CAI9731032.1 cytochrome c oxidase subunit 5A, mitochondrial-like [Octopus vulgaris]
MLRAVITRLALPVARHAIQTVKVQHHPSLAVFAVRHFKAPAGESDEDFDTRYENHFRQPNLDGWEIRKAMNELCSMDLVPEPRIIIAAMHACRRLNDYALAVRFLEAIKDKCGSRVKEIWPYVIQEIQPTLDELGILTPEEMGYDKPELALKSVYDM